MQASDVLCYIFLSRESWSLCHRENCRKLFWQLNFVTCQNLCSTINLHLYHDETENNIDLENVNVSKTTILQKRQPTYCKETVC